MRLKYLMCIAALLPAICIANDRLNAGETLSNNAFIMSPNGNYSLVMQSDGSLVMYRADGSKRHGMAKHGTHANMQYDGNFVEYSGSTAIWNTQTGGRCPCPSYHYLRIWDNGDLTIDYGDFPMAGHLIGRIWSLGRDPNPLTSITGMVEYELPPGKRPSAVPVPFFPPSYSN
ncbi:hypothetical protein [Massilia aquatica]|uniref:Bulb-type lectin domain-containing protein n=1 Tax=Massilia aquatica TaxID=2609000 RepID=A0ABX0MAV2_9BURK|nr:hypothetical protein [Massilia aquatica]NHZ43748.1 hypothetical protein [Massilia aquatica]